MTPAQKEAAKRAELRLQQMRDAGMLVQALDAPDRPKKPVYDKKKNKKAEAEAKAAEEKRLKEEKERIEAEKQAEKAAEVQKLKEAEEAAAKAKEAEGVLECWEDAFGEDGDIKESWDDDSDEEMIAGKQEP